MTINRLAMTHFLSLARNMQSWCPAVDIYRCGDGWLIKCELAGVEEGDVQLFAKGRSISLTGRRRDLLVKNGHQSYSMEIAYNHFERAIELPMNIDRSSIRYEFQDGMLLIYLQ